jgi:predicted metal-dependent hydrolase
MPNTAENQRSLTLGGRPIAYLLKRTNRRTIGLAVDQRGLRVSAPLRTRIGDIEQLLHNHQQWVIDKLSAWEQRVNSQTAPAVIESGLTFPWLDQTFTLHLETTGTRNTVFWGTSHLTLCLRASANTEKAFRKTLMDAAKKYFEMRIHSIAQIAQQLSSPLHLDPPPLVLTSARTRWGSCSQKALRLNWRLMHLSRELVDYVIAHELAHLVEMNHSPRFWAVVERLYPDWQAARRELRAVGRTCPKF